MSRFPCILIFALLAIGGFSGPGFAQPSVPAVSSQADFERFCELMEGRWVGEMTWIADWPGLGKRGDKSIAFLSYTPTDDGKGMLGKFVGGTGSATGLAAYDAVAETIRFNFVVSGGYFASEVITVDGNQLTITGTGSLPDGRPHKPRVIRTFSEDGMSFTDKASGELAGEPTDEVTQTFRKVSGQYRLAEDAAELKEFGDKMSGRWLREIVYVHDWEGAEGGRGDKAIGYHEFQWINDGQALREVNFDGKNRAESIFAWDPTTKRALAFGTAATGGMMVGHLQKVGENEWKLTPVQGGLASGEKVGGEIRYTISGDGTRMDASGVVTLDGKPLDELQDVYQRLSP